MNDYPFIEKYSCKCSGGDYCYIVRRGDGEVDFSYPTKNEAEEALEKLNSGT